MKNIVLFLVIFCGWTAGATCNGLLHPPAQWPLAAQLDILFLGQPMALASIVEDWHLDREAARAYRKKMVAVLRDRFHRGPESRTRLTPAEKFILDGTALAIEHSEALTSGASDMILWQHLFAPEALQNLPGSFWRREQASSLSRQAQQTGEALRQPVLTYARGRGVEQREAIDPWIQDLSVREILEALVTEESDSPRRFAWLQGHALTYLMGQQSGTPELFYIRQRFETAVLALQMGWVDARRTHPEILQHVATPPLPRDHRAWILDAAVKRADVLRGLRFPYHWPSTTDPRTTFP